MEKTVPRPWHRPAIWTVAVILVAMIAALLMIS
jgi:hypothetical protein